MKVLTILAAFSEQGVIDKPRFFQYNIFRANDSFPPIGGAFPGTRPLFSGKRQFNALNYLKRAAAKLLPFLLFPFCIQPDGSSVRLEIYLIGGIP